MKFIFIIAVLSSFHASAGVKRSGPSASPVLAYKGWTTTAAACKKGRGTLSHESGMRIDARLSTVAAWAVEKYQTHPMFDKLCGAARK